jgi:hypothetical protein
VELHDGRIDNLDPVERHLTVTLQEYIIERMPISGFGGR